MGGRGRRVHPRWNHHPAACRSDHRKSARMAPNPSTGRNASNSTSNSAAAPSLSPQTSTSSRRLKAMVSCESDCNCRHAQAFPRAGWGTAMGRLSCSAPRPAGTPTASGRLYWDAAAVRVAPAARAAPLAGRLGRQALPGASRPAPPTYDRTGCGADETTDQRAAAARRRASVREFSGQLPERRCQARVESGLRL